MWYINVVLLFILILSFCRDSGQNTLVRKIPDTITEWKGNAICLNTASGLGISSISGITAFQPFFLSFTLPYSAVRNEVVPVLVTVFNYLTQCLVVRIPFIYKDFIKLVKEINRIYIIVRSIMICV